MFAVMQESKLLTLIIKVHSGADFGSLHFAQNRRPSVATYRKAEVS